ncbi:MAG: DUF3575 domain-containing protein [Bacteroidales bacterium]|nr:DUF3575 domain-containing protein [Bacteroidales bacterium]
MIKQVIHIILFLTILGQAKAQFIDYQIEQGDVRSNIVVIKTDPTLFFYGQIPGFGEYRLSTEIALAYKSSIQIGLSLNTKSLLMLLQEVGEDTLNTSSFSAKGARFQLTYKYYPFGKHISAPEGFFVGPHISYSFVNLHYKNTSPKYSDYRVNYFNVALLFGYQFIFNEKFVIEVFQGLGYRDNRMWNSYTENQEGDKLNYDLELTLIPGDLKIYFGANFGINF